MDSNDRAELLESMATVHDAAARAMPDSACDGGQEAGMLFRLAEAYRKEASRLRAEAGPAGDGRGWKYL